MSDTASVRLPKQKERSRFAQSIHEFRYSTTANVLLSVLIPLITTLTLEWIARGTLGPNKQGTGFVQAIVYHFPSFLISYLLLVCLYVFISQLTGLHPVATGVVGLVGNVPAVVTYYKLTMRGEPFLPWDLAQMNELMDVSDSLSLAVPTAAVVTALLFVFLIAVTSFVHLPDVPTRKKGWQARLAASGTSLLVCCGLLFGVFLNPKGSALVGIHEDMWMQDRYYRNHGVITGFLTNLQLLNIQVPKGYNGQEVQRIASVAGQKNSGPYFAGSYATQTDAPVQHPDIIFLMAESFWDVTALDGIVYDQELLPNLTALREEGAYGYAYTPSFGGGTCDVEFEALTGFSVEHLPAGSKPYQQYVTQDIFSLPQYLKSEGYKTLAIHGYGRRFWSRDTAYPRLGIDTFIASEDFQTPHTRRGFISDDAMVDRIIREYELRGGDAPLFIHAVTMQNHTSYNPNRYPADELVRVLRSPGTLPAETIGQLEDCATGIREMDAALGKLTDYLRTSNRPTILVFWGDHMNPMSDGYTLFEETGFIPQGETSDPALYKTPLLIWSNYADNKVDLGTLATYNITPAMMDLYGLAMPDMFRFLADNLGVMRARTHGVTTLPDGTHSYDMTPEQEQLFREHALLQYDFMFGECSLNSYTQGAG